MGLIDSHAHLDSFESKGTLDGVLSRARAAGVEATIAIGTEPGDWMVHRRIALNHPKEVYFSVGLHPCNVEEGWEKAVSQIEGFWNMDQPLLPVALGECGLDRFHLPKEQVLAEAAFARQRLAFSAQLEIARKLACPIVIHSRQAFASCIEMIDASGVDWSKVVFHCFSEGEAEARILALRGGRASFTGILTYKNADSVRAAAKAQGLDRFFVETDAPYLAPVPHRGQPNEPAFVRHTAEYAALLFGIPYEELARITTANARSFFGL